MNRHVRVLFLLAAATAIPAAGQNRACKAVTWHDCGEIGCAQGGSREAAAVKVGKATPEALRSAVHVHRILEVDNFVTLQLFTDKAWPNSQGFGIRIRDDVTGARLDAGGLFLGEGMVVTLRGYVVGHPHANQVEIETCNLIRIEDNNWWVNIADQPNDTDFESVLTIMTPAARAGKLWDLQKLRWIAERKWMVRVTGQLFYDSKHVVNRNAGSDLFGEPHRLSLWEIHPIIEFEVCRNRIPESCRTAENDSWQKLEDVVVSW